MAAEAAAIPMAAEAAARQNRRPTGTTLNRARTPHAASEAPSVTGAAPA